jgi:hypothetical protein
MAKVGGTMDENAGGGSAGQERGDRRLVSPRVSTFYGVAADQWVRSMTVGGS